MSHCMESPMKLTKRFAVLILVLWLDLSSGEEGDKGDPGFKGQQGNRGRLGPAGRHGEHGQDGERGDPGKSKTEVLNDFKARIKELNARADEVNKKIEECKKKDGCKTQTTIKKKQIDNDFQVKDL